MATGQRQIGFSRGLLPRLLLVLALIVQAAGCGGEAAIPEVRGDPGAVTARVIPPALPSGEVERFVGRAATVLERLGRRARVSVLVADLDTGDVLFERDPDVALVPASNMKVLTGAAFVASLGVDHRLSTRFYADGEIDGEGRLKGDLIVVGGGDPSITGALFDDDPMRAIDVVAESLAARGLRAIEGRLLADGRLFSGPVTGPDWPKDGPESRYMAEVSALVYNDNRTFIECRVENARPRLRAWPDIGYIEIDDRLRIDRSQNIVVSRGADDNRFTVTGRIKPTSFYDADVSIHDGDLYYLTALARALETHGVEVGGIGRVAADRVLPEGKPMLDFVARAERSLVTMLTTSQNLYAEIFFRLLGARLAGEGSFQGGSLAMERWLAERGILEAGTVVADGSGLSRANRLSARQLVVVLDAMHRDPRAREFREALAQPGQEGTLANRMQELEGRLFAKTGTLNGVSALSGYIEIDEGRWAAFAILCNDCVVSRARAIQNEICRALAEVRP